MPAIVKVPFIAGSTYSPEIATEMLGVAFDNQPQYIGHFNKILDSDLSDAPGQIKDRVTRNDTNLAVSAGSGLSCIVNTGRALYGVQTFNLTTSSIVLAASAVNYVYVDVDGVVKARIINPTGIRAMLALVTTNATGVTSVVDMREGYKVETLRPYAITVQTFGGQGDTGSFVSIGGETLDAGEYFFVDFIVPFGRVITVSKMAKIYCSGKVEIIGVVNVTAATEGGARAVLNGRQMSGTPGKNLGGGNGVEAPDTYNYLASPVGSGGGGGGMAGHRLETSTYATKGGSGGGCLWIEAAGTVLVSGYIYAQGTSGEPGASRGTIGGYINGGHGGDCGVGGAGGGSGGLILLRSLKSITVTGQLDVSGGAGGGGVPISNVNCSGEDGAGGGGGYIYLGSKTIVTTGANIQRAGGLPGSGFSGRGNSACGIGGVGGSFGGAGGANGGNGGNGTAGSSGILNLVYTRPV